MMVSQLVAVQPDLGAGMHTAEVDPDPLPLPSGRSLETPGIPTGAGVGGAQSARLEPEVPRRLPGLAPKPLSLPGAGNLDPVGEEPDVEPPLREASVFR